MKMAILGSGSKGNATVIQSAHTTLLIDCGLGPRLLTQRLADFNLTFQDIDAIFISHEHDDHIKGLKSIFRHHTPVLFTHELTIEALDPSVHPYITSCMAGTAFHFQDVTLTPFQISHDAVAPLGVIVEAEHRRLVHLTDTGFIPQAAYPYLAGAHAYVLEANYDAQLLFNSARPYHLKKRIDSVKGHLSNVDASIHLAHLVQSHTHTVVFAHLSEDCNRPDLVVETADRIFQEYRIDPTPTLKPALARGLEDWILI